MSDKRVTEEDIQAAIAAEYYFSGEDGANGADPCSPVFHRAELSRLTFCVLVLKNGYTVTGESACANPDTYDHEVGKWVAKQNAMHKIWPLLGYELRSRLAERAA